MSSCPSPLKSPASISSTLLPTRSRSPRRTLRRPSPRSTPTWLRSRLAVARSRLPSPLRSAARIDDWPSPAWDSARPVRTTRALADARPGASSRIEVSTTSTAGDRRGDGQRNPGRKRRGRSAQSTQAPPVSPLLVPLLRPTTVCGGTPAHPCPKDETTHARPFPAAATVLPCAYVRNRSAGIWDRKVTASSALLASLSPGVDVELPVAMP